ncbi:MAG: FxSxx-COOH system tetratricopeptide repeat protein [Firmicutes bacterium]|nr:FxSxx-COOH system tetratricopeptide repeat protein [Bacillota bacterium]
MTFSEFANMLYPFCGNGDKIADYVVRLIDNVLVDPLSEEDERKSIAGEYNPIGNLTASGLEKIYRDEPGRNIPKRAAAEILSHLDKARFADYLEAFAEDTLEGISKALSRVGITSSRENAAAVCADLFAEILTALAAGVKKAALAAHNLPGVTPYFTGRTDALDSIHSTFTKSKTIAITQAFYGLGGIGKTQLVLKYAFEHLPDYKYICWINAETEDDALLSAKSALSVVFGVDGAESIEKSEEILASFLDCCKKNRRGLLIFDNVENYAVVQKFLAKPANIHVLITTRLAHLQEVPVRIDIGVYPPQEAVLFIQNRLGKPEAPRGSGELAMRLGYLPLALEQAAAYIAANDRTVESYLALLEEYAPELFENDEGLIAYDKAVAATLRISIRRIESRASKQFLNVLSYFAADGIRLRFFEGLEKGTMPPLLERDLDNSLKMDKVIRSLTQYSLVKREDDVLSLHRLVQEIVRGSHGKNLNFLRSGLYIMFQKLGFDYADAQSRSNFALLVPHADNIALLAEKALTQEPKEAHLAIGRNYYLIADYNYRVGNYDASLSFFDRAIIQYIAGEGDRHSDVAMLRNEQANVYREMGEYEKALASYDIALSIRKEEYGERHEYTASVMNGIALTYCRQCKYEESLALHKEAYEIFKERLGENDLDVAVACNNIAISCAELGNYDEALEWYGRAIAIYEHELGTEHPDTVDTYSNIANVYADKGEYDTALEWCEKAKNARIALLGENHPDVATLYMNTALIYTSKGLYDEAAELYERAIEIFENTMGTESPMTADAYDSFGSLFDELDQLDDALYWYEKALKIRKRALGDSHANTAGSYNNIAVVYEKQGRLDECLRYLDKVRKIRSLIYSNDSTEFAGLYSNYALVYSQKGDMKKALPYLEKAIEIREKRLGIHHDDTGMVYTNMGIVLERDGRAREALGWYRKALAAYEKSLGADHPHTVDLAETIRKMELSGLS